MKDVQWGTMGEWASGIGTTAAVIVALWATRHQSKVADKERRLRYSQAMSCWLEWGVSTTSAWWTGVVLNSGQDPVTDWNVQLCRIVNCTAIEAQHTHDWLQLMSNLNEGMLAPGRTADVGVPNEVTIHSGSLPAMKVEWRDAEGRLWHRTGGRQSSLEAPEEH